MKNDTIHDEDRVALVTGSGKGVGAGIIRALTGHGIKCCINCNTNPAMAEQLLQEVTASGGEAFICQADVTDPAQLHGMVEAVIERYGRLDILVNNAAMQPNLFIDQYSEESLRKLWNTNAGGYFHTVRECLPYLRQAPRASIINVASVHSKRPTMFDAGYSMTKGAIRMLTKELALELLPDGINVNAIELGACKIEFKTGRPVFQAYIPPETRNPVINEQHRDIYVYPEEVGELIYYLVSDDAQHITGTDARIDRGLVLQ